MYGRSVRDQERVSLVQLLLDIHTFDVPRPCPGFLPRGEM